MIRKIKDWHAEGVVTATIDALKPIKNLVRTIGFDNGLEFAQYDRIVAAVAAKKYFADPLPSWQRGTNED